MTPLTIDEAERRMSAAAPGSPAWAEAYAALEAAVFAAIERGDPPRRRTLTTNWCVCDPPCAFHSYPGDGACSCGMRKHHVHGICGGIQQIG